MPKKMLNEHKSFVNTKVCLSLEDKERIRKVRDELGVCYTDIIRCAIDEEYFSDVPVNIVKTTTMVIRE
jgi:hypothetical protein